MKRSKGFSLIEVMICTTLAVLLLTSIAAAMLGVLQGVRVNDAQMRARQYADRILRQIVGEVRRGCELELESPTGTTYSRLRILDSAEWDSAAAEWKTGNAHWTVFEVSSGRLFMKRLKSDAYGNISTESSIPLATVRNTTFRSVLDDGVNRGVTVDLTIDCLDSGSKTYSFSLTGTAMARSLSKDQVTGS